MVNHISKYGKKGKLFVLCGPSGVGKKTLISYILTKDYLNLDISISLTTRNKREGEEEGSDYFFVSKEEFLEAVREGKLLEYASFFNNYYGTPKAFVERKLEEERNVLLEVEVIGFRQVMAQYPEAISIFISPPTLSNLYERLLKRNTENLGKIEQRLVKAKKEMKEKDFFKYVIVNDKLEMAMDELERLIFAEIN